MASPKSELLSLDAAPLGNLCYLLEDEAFKELDSLSFREILEEDSRPTFIFDLDPDYSVEREIRPLFFNKALKLHGGLIDHFTRGTEGTVSNEDTGTMTTYEKFRDWVMGIGKLNSSEDVFSLPILYHRLLWTSSTIRQRWRIVSGNALLQDSDNPRLPWQFPSSKYHEPVQHGSKITNPTEALASAAAIPTDEIFPRGMQQPHSDLVILGNNTNKEKSFRPGSVTLGTPDSSWPDWTVAHPRGFITEHVALARSVDWSCTSLGPMDSWSMQFRELANLVMRSPHGAVLLWGEELTMLYNEAYADVVGDKHPNLMGTGYKGPFPELWDQVAPVMHECARTGRSSRRKNDTLFMSRHGYFEETSIDWSFVPMYGGTDRILGFYADVFETTDEILTSRRMRTLRYLGECLNATRTVKQFWSRVLDGLQDNHHEVPFALLYSIADSCDADTASQTSDSTASEKMCLLEGSIGVPESHPAAPQNLDLKGSQEGFIPAFREAMRTREPTTLRLQDGTFPGSLLEGVEWRGYGDPCREVIIFPLRPTNGDTVFAFLLIGIHPRRAYDDDYKSFAAMLNRQLATSLASVLLFEGESRRSRQLSQQLELQSNRMQRMTELSPLGMYLYDLDGVLVEGNDRWYEMTGMSRYDHSDLSFANLMMDSSRETSLKAWRELLAGNPVTREFQLKPPRNQPRDLDGEPIEYWVLATSQPEMGCDGQVVSIMGSIADISQIKWAQSLQEKRLREAEETKRQQNEFIDITSHEMRNPLSAVSICADDIRDTLMQHTFCSDDQKPVEDCIEAANNIALCVQHQKAIVDDILTVSKLDSNLLLITPVPTQLLAIVQQAVRMFKPEVQAKDIKLTVVRDASLERLGIDWLLMDPTRLLQIIVNLITNAIKFTQHCAKRAIAVHISISPEQPDFSAIGLEVFPTKYKQPDITTGEDWGTGELLYLRVDVEDTGCGLTIEEKELLFKRFAQASPRTHIQYGGSGLGLFISRQLAILHGGQIGVISVAGKGSTFGFFMQCKRTGNDNTRSGASNQNLEQAQKRENAEEEMIELGASASSPEPEKTRPKIPELVEPEKRHILLVEDNIVNQRLLSRQLKKAGCIVSTADNGVFALEHLRTTQFHRSTPNGTPLSVILMDWEMPVMNGLTCCKRIREMEWNGELISHVPIIGVTANVRVEQIAEAKESGMNEVVSKPFRIPELLARIEVVLQRLKRC